MKKIVIILWLILLLAIGNVGLATEISPPAGWYNDVPFYPSFLEIIPPSVNIPPEIANYSGIWAGRMYGKWNTERNIVIVVKEIPSPTEVVIIYCYGILYGGDVPDRSGGYGIWKGTFDKKNRLIIERESARGKITVTLKPTRDPDKIKYEYDRARGEYTSEATLKRLKIQ